jgi:hypothetical protein
LSSAYPALFSHNFRLALVEIAFGFFQKDFGPDKFCGQNRESERDGEEGRARQDNHGHAEQEHGEADHPHDRSSQPLDVGNPSQL